MNSYKEWAGKPYLPSNGTEGMYFTSEFCDCCIRQHPDPDNKRQCNDILLEALIGNQPPEWKYDAMGSPTCTAFVNWDWGNNDDDRGWNEPPPPEPIDPNQLLMPFGFEELFPTLFGEDIAVTKYAIFETA